MLSQWAKNLPTLEYHFINSNGHFLPKRRLVGVENSSQQGPQVIQMPQVHILVEFTQPLYDCVTSHLHLPLRCFAGDAWTDFGVALDEQFEPLDAWEKNGKKLPHIFTLKCDVTMGLPQR